MITLFSVAAAVAALCLVLSGLMITIMILGSPTRTWYRELNTGSIAVGLSMIAIGLFLLADTRHAEKAHQVRYNRGGLVTPAQGYLAGFGLITLGSIITVWCFRHRQKGTDPA